MLSNKRFNGNHSNHRYNDLFNSLKRKKHFIVVLISLIIGLFTYKSGTCILFFTPFLFIILTLFFNQIIKHFYRRNIIFPVRGDTKSDIRVLDYAFGSIIIIFSLLFPLFIFSKLN